MAFKQNIKRKLRLIYNKSTCAQSLQDDTYNRLGIKTEHKTEIKPNIRVFGACEQTLQTAFTLYIIDVHFVVNCVVFKMFEQTGRIYAGMFTKRSLEE